MANEPRWESLDYIRKSELIAILREIDADRSEVRERYGDLTFAAQLISHLEGKPRKSG